MAGMGSDVFEREWDRHFVASVRRAVERTYELAVGLPPEVAYGILTEELRRRGIDPEPDAVFDGALLISRGERPAVLGLDEPDSSP